MTQPVLRLALAALAATAFAAPALAQDELEPAGGDGGLDVSATVTGVSDYRFRGVSSSDRDPAIQGSVDLNYRGFYVGAWASSIARIVGRQNAQSELIFNYESAFTKPWKSPSLQRKHGFTTVYPAQKEGGCTVVL